MMSESLENLQIRLAICNFSIESIANDPDPRAPAALEALKAQKAAILARIQDLPSQSVVVNLKSATLQSKIREN